MYLSAGSVQEKHYCLPLPLLIDSSAVQLAQTRCALTYTFVDPIPDFPSWSSANFILKNLMITILQSKLIYDRLVWRPLPDILPAAGLCSLVFVSSLLLELPKPSSNRKIFDPPNHIEKSWKLNT